MKYSKSRFILCDKDEKLYIDKAEVIKYYLGDSSVFSEKKTPTKFPISMTEFIEIDLVPYSRYLDVYKRHGMSMIRDHNIKSQELAKLPVFTAIIDEFRQNYPEAFI